MEIVRIAYLVTFLYLVKSQQIIDRHAAYISYDNHKPIFSKCADYKPSVAEEQNDVFVIKVEATDVDPPENGGTVSYKIMQKEGERVYFTINNVTGEIRNVNAFDRDEPYRQKEVYLSVQATDNGRPPLADICTFKVTISDINDNAPSFDQARYQTQVSEDLKPNSEVVRVFAFDSDDGENSRLTYSFEKNDQRFAEYFRIDSSTGVIYLKQSLKENQGMRFEEMISVSDNGQEPKRSYADLSILVVGSDKQLPRLTADKPSISLSENFNSYETTLITLDADSNIKDESVVFELMKGKTRQTNMDSTFVLTQDDTQARITLGRPLDYETVPDYSLTVIARNKEGLSVSTTLKINIMDVNDEMPTFIDLLRGSVVENDVRGAVAMQVKADDRDGTSPNNLVKYELLTYTELFEIDEETGHIRAKTKFDRETESVYHVQVKAYDGAPSALKKNSTEPNSAVQTFEISIEDKNDNPPVIQQSPYIVHNISENSDLYSIVVEVQAVDKDTASLITYRIVDGNVGEAFLIENTTGRIKVKNKLDFEKIESYNLTVMAHDGMFNDTTKVFIYILNENDEPPVFEDYNSDVNIIEERTYVTCVLRLNAYDPDIKDRSADQKITYEVEKKFLKIDPNGCLTIVKPLDRDLPNGTPKVQAYVIAYDSFGPTPLKSFAEVNFHLTDINDNAPFLNVTEVVWYENKVPDLITKLSADDYDSIENGPPFSFLMDDSAEQIVKDRFEIEPEGYLHARVIFDREERKYYDIPIAITDRGTPAKTGVSILKVIIGDENDNAAQNGLSSITVYKYEELNENIPIGRVYVNDPDDWDLSDKIFQFKFGNPSFDLDENDRGMIIMHNDIEPGFYTLEFIVTESHPPNIIDNRVEAKVDVEVKLIPKEAVVKSGSIRLNGTSIESLIETDDQNLSKLDILQREVAHLMNTSLENVDVFTVLPSGNYIDVRFSAHGSPYYAPVKLNNKILENQEKLEMELGVHMHMVGISACLDESACDGLSCSNNLNIKTEPAVVFTNKTSFVGIKAVVEAICECVVRLPDGCNGVPSVDGSTCDCPPGREGPNCEIVAVGFSGNSWAMYPTLDACNTTSISLTISPQTPNGLIFYTGPSTLAQAQASKDFLSLELRDGSIVLKLDLGYGPLEMVAQSERDLNDGSSHDIEIKVDSKEVQLIVDNCGSSCLKWLSLPSGKGFLNVNGPLQIGGMKKYYNDDEFRLISDQLSPINKGFIGCIKNFRYNGYLYNLGAPSDEGPSVHINCDYSTPAAFAFGIHSKFLVAVLVCVAVFMILLLAVVVYTKKHKNFNEKDIDDTRATIINYEDEGGGESDASFDLSVLRSTNNMYEKQPIKDNFQSQEALAALPAFLDNKKENCDKDPNNVPFDDVRHYAYEGDGNSTGSLSSLASCTDEGDLKFNYLSNFGPRFRKLADMYGNDNSDDDSQDAGEESWC